MALPAFLDLCRAYQVLSDELLTAGVNARTVDIVAQVAWGSLRGRSGVPKDVLTRVRTLWSDGRLRDWHPRQRLLLVWFGVLAVAAWPRDEGWARAVLARASGVAQRVWVLASWQPWMGKRPGVMVKRRLGACADFPTPEDPSGDPEEEPEPKPDLESVAAWSWSSIGEVFDGLDPWHAVVQEHLGLPLGDMARLGHPDWVRLCGRDLLSPVEVQVFLAA